MPHLRHRCSALHRAGSALLYCLALSSIVVVLGYGFLRSVMRDTVAGDRSQHVQLAQAAARAGLAEATEAILADYVSTSLTVGRGPAGPGNVITLTDPPTFLDGPYRAPFVSETHPNRLSGAIDDNTPDSYNDVRAWNLVTDPWLKQGSWNVTGMTTSRWRWYDHGMVSYDGRGRWIEPGFRNLSRPGPDSATPLPVAATRFLAMDNALGFAQPERHGGLFLDSELRRMPSDGTPAGDLAARAAARYRLRYAIGVVDLGGHLLCNPKADLDADWRNPNNEYRRPPLWIQAAAEAWYNMVPYFPSFIDTVPSGSTVPLRWQHVFLGRGNASNFDRRATSGTTKVTFPLMFRLVDGLRYNNSPMANPAGTALPTPRPMNYWGLYGKSVSREAWLGGSGWVPANFGSGAGETTELYRQSVIAGVCSAVQGLAAGNEPLTQVGAYDQQIFAMVGPQTSWFNQHQSGQGASATFLDYHDGANHYYEQGPPLETAMFVPTPFGRGVSVYSPGATPRKWYEGHVNTPWHVNFLTAPPIVMRAMLGAYLPPAFRKATPTSEIFRTFWDVTNRYPPGSSHDLFTELAGPAFSEWPTPKATDAGGTAYPNFLIPEPRTADQIYPRVMWNSPGLDNFGKDIDAKTLIGGHAACSIMGAAFGMDGSGANLTTETGYVTTPPVDFPDNATWRRTAPASDSYWTHVQRAFASTVAIARASWVQYPNRVVPAARLTSDLFTGGLVRDPTLYDTIEEIDQAFLRQLGEDFVNPGNGIPLVPITCTSSYNQSYRPAATAVSNTIRTLSTSGLLAAGAYTSAQRASLLERVLNDVRMSFFGASPQYYDRFRPLDFDGDGVVMCSCYAPSGDAAERALGLDRHAPLEPDVATYGNRRGAPPLHWFSLTGTFFIGKSHYYRVICRGELFDNVTMRPVTDATIESVLVVDPEGTDIRQSHVLFQRWHFNRSRAHLSQVDR